MVGARGIEPPASWSRTKRATTALRPDFSNIKSIISGESVPDDYQKLFLINRQVLRPDYINKLFSN